MNTWLDPTSYPVMKLSHAAQHDSGQFDIWANQRVMLLVSTCVSAHTNQVKYYSATQLLTSEKACTRRGIQSTETISAVPLSSCLLPLWGRYEALPSWTRFWANSYFDQFLELMLAPYKSSGIIKRHTCPSPTPPQNWNPFKAEDVLI